MAVKYLSWTSKRFVVDYSASYYGLADTLQSADKQLSMVSTGFVKACEADITFLQKEFQDTVQQLLVTYRSSL